MNAIAARSGLITKRQRLARTSKTVAQLADRARIIGNFVEVFHRPRAFAWYNAVRSRLYFQTAKASDGTEPNQNLRTLECKKSNYGPAGGQITLEWKNGLFIPVNGPAGLDKMATEAKAEDVFLTLIKRFNSQGRNAGVRKGTSYAPALFAEKPDNQGIGKAQFAAAMTRLLAAEKIRIEETGPKSRRSQTIVPTTELDANEA